MSGQSNPAIWMCLGLWCLPSLIIAWLAWFARGRRELYLRMKRDGLIAANDEDEKQ